MIVYVVKITRYLDNRDYNYSEVDVYGVYSNLALAGHAVIQAINNREELIIFKKYVMSWGYWFKLFVWEDEELLPYGEIEIGRVTVNE